MFFLGIILWKGASRFNGEGMGGVFQIGGALFLSGGGAPWGGISFDGKGFRKKLLDGTHHTQPPTPTMGNPAPSLYIYIYIYMIIIKRYCFQTEQLKHWQKQNILYFENDIILW